MSVIGLLKEKARAVPAMLLGIVLLSPVFSYSGQYVHSPDYLKDPMVARLQPERGKNALTELEKAEIKEYGFTAHELIIYNYFNREPGERQREAYMRIYTITADGRIFRYDFHDRLHYFYKNKLALMKLDGPGARYGDVYRS